MIAVFDISGELLLEEPITQGCKHIQELMISDYIELSWNDIYRPLNKNSNTLPAGAYIEWEGVRYSLLEPYSPKQKDEVEYIYTPQFHSPVMSWKKRPFFLYTKTASGVTHEPDWELTDTPRAFMECIVKSLQEECGETWSFDVATDLPASAYLSFSNSNILSGLTSIANAFETEWYADYNAKKIYLGKIQLGEPVALEVGVNIGVPSVSANNEGYYTRYYAFGSTRNIDQSYNGAQAQSIVNRRLTLDPKRYPGGFFDVKGHYENDVFVSDLKKGEEFTTMLYFDDVYPRATETDGEGNSLNGLRISDVRERRLFVTDSETGEKIQVGTDDNGNPVYKMYSTWYFRIPKLNEWVSGNDSDTALVEYIKDLLIEGTSLSCSFESGALQGYEFELKLIESAEVKESATGTSVNVRAGDFEILFITENDLIIPTTATGLIPADGDVVVLFNLKMPQGYIDSAYLELEREMLKEIQRRQEDMNSYTFRSNPVAFSDNNPNLSIGRAVTFKNGDYSYSTRVQELTTQLDFNIEQEITIGNKQIKGSISQLKEEVASANTNIDIIAALNQQTIAIQDAYRRAQEQMAQGFVEFRKWFTPHKNATTGALESLQVNAGLWSHSFISSRGKDATDNSSQGFDIVRMWEELAAKSSGDEVYNTIIDESHIPDTIARTSDFEQFATKEDLAKSGLKWKTINE